MLRNRQCPTILGAILCAVSFTGCGEGPSFYVEDSPEVYDEVLPAFNLPPAAQVEGVVQLDGRPVPGAGLWFYSRDSGAYAVGRTDEQGHYRLYPDRRHHQIDAGRYRVSISTAVPATPGGPVPPEILPSVYNSRTTQFVELGPGKRTLDFSLRSDAESDWRELIRTNTFDGQALSIIVFVAEGLGPEWLGCYGGTEVETPNIDSLAARGMKFTNVYSMPQPVAARVTLLTGQYPCRHGWIGDWNVPEAGQGCWFDWEQYAGLGERFARANFSTCIVGQWQLNNFQKQPDALLHHGFRRWCVWTGAAPNDPATRQRHWNPHLYVNGPIKNTAVDENAELWPTAGVRQYDWGAAGTYPGEFGPDLFTAFLPNMTRRNGRRPFFLYYAATLPATTHSSTPDEPQPTDEAELYRARVRYTDKVVGRLLAFLDDTRRRERTFFIFTSDGGTPPEIPGSQQEDSRGVLSERAVRVPLIVAGPASVPAGAESDALVDFTDLAPTVCDLALIQSEPDPSFDGHSVAPLLVGCDDPQPREWIMSLSGELELDGQHVEPAQPFAERVLRDRQFKVHVNSLRTIDALYDLQVDPDEQQNLMTSDAPEHQQALDKFRAVIETLPERDAAPRYAPLSPPVAPPTTTVSSPLTGRSTGG
ncbi:MAG: sulfatase-like hydrolase/transferase [Planctomycetaceae bacterium]|nr:sulfatase-like hydrolase/transferase [Planctomycetaceae bacterium]